MKLLIILLILSLISCLINCKSPKTTQKAKAKTQKAESTTSNGETTTRFPKIFDFKPKVKLDHDELIDWDFSKVF